MNVSKNAQVLLREAAALLRFQGELGLEGLELSDEIFVERPSDAHHDRSVPASASSDVTGPTGARGTRASAPDSHESPGGTRHAGPSDAEQELITADTVQALEQQLEGCKRCKLASRRTHIVFGTGDPDANLMFIGEGPGRDEDLAGEPFVGAAGQLLDRMIRAMTLKRGEVYIANIVKCRPPNNRDPQPDEVAACERFLKAQIRLIGPKVIVALGRCAVQTLLRDKRPISRLRGRWQQYEGIAMMPTFHPAYLLRNPGDKRLVWHDLQQVMQRLGLEIPKTTTKGAS